MSQSQPFAPLVEVTRGYEIESEHAGAIAVVDSTGHLLASIGQPTQPAYLRSCAKPFQALAFVCSGAADACGATEQELAVVCASHSGEAEHVALVESLMKKTGVTRDDLLCGIHPPFDKGTRDQLSASGKSANVLHNNCSGKHVGMIATAKHLDLPFDDYIDPEHPVQLAILGLLSTLAGLEPDEIGVSIDGCSAPVFYVPLRSFSLALARLADQGEGSDTWLRHPRVDDDQDLDIDELQEEPEEETMELSDGFPVSIQEGLSRVWRAMIGHPSVIAGSSTRICTDLMRVAQQFGVPLLAKSGAEGTYAIAAFHEDEGIGITVKVEDGGQRARDAAVVECLLQLGILPDEARGPLAGYHRQLVQTLRGEAVGEVRPVFRLNRGLPR
ncbi:MAG: asparaginase [Candidatus Eisenbacteria bacterium]